MPHLDVFLDGGDSFSVSLTEEEFLDFSPSVHQLMRSGTLQCVNFSCGAHIVVNWAKVSAAFVYPEDEDDDENTDH